MFTLQYKCCNKFTLQVPVSDYTPYTHTSIFHAKSTPCILTLLAWAIVSALFADLQTLLISFDFQEIGAHLSFSPLSNRMYPSVLFNPLSTSPKDASAYNSILRTLRFLNFPSSVGHNGFIWMRVEFGICLCVREFFLGLNALWIGVWIFVHWLPPFLSLSRSSFMPTGCYIAELDLDLDFGIDLGSGFSGFCFSPGTHNRLLLQLCLVRCRPGFQHGGQPRFWPPMLHPFCMQLVSGLILISTLNQIRLHCIDLSFRFYGVLP